jgi:hypothetical protein
MAPVLTELCPRSVAAAMEANRCVLGRALGQSPLAVLDEAPGLLAYRTGIPHPLFNSVLSADLKIEEADRRRMQRAAGRGPRRRSGASISPPKWRRAGAICWPACRPPSIGPCAMG